MSITLFDITDEDKGRNVSNANFSQLLELVGLNDKLDCYGGKLEGIELVEFNLKLKSLNSIVKKNQLEFTTKTIVEKGLNGAISIDLGKNADYWERLINDILNISEKATTIVWC